MYCIINIFYDIHVHVVDYYRTKYIDILYVYMVIGYNKLSNIYNGLMFKDYSIIIRL